MPEYKITRQWIVEDSFTVKAPTPQAAQAEAEGRPEPMQVSETGEEHYQGMQIENAATGNIILEIGEEFVID